jgi:hypothetical protein
MQDTRWDHGLMVTGEGEGLVGHAGAVLLRKLADRAGLTAALGSALARKGKFPLVDRGVALVSMAVAIAGARVGAGRGAAVRVPVAFCGREAGWLVIDLDATLITACSDKEGAAATFKMGYGFHPLGAWCANTAESLAMLLRPGNAGSNTFTDHAAVLAAALRQIPARFRSRLLVRVDGAGA